MYLKHLRLHGYKTFANPTEFEFNSGITAIVGPNGSGKSNITDAIRWVLGEQSFSTLRAKRTEDMIFAGGKQRARLGMAEVSMTFDNVEQWLPIGFSEVTITRRAYRSGENEYLLNGTRVRLKDIVEILSKAGLGRSKYVVIGQGLVDAALSLRAVERRSLIEAAAGIEAYLTKRQAALNRLAETRQNVLRVNDIINEISPRLRRLEKQAKRAEQHAILSHTLGDLLRTWYGYKWGRAASELQRAQKRVEQQEELLQAQRDKLKQLGTRLQALRDRRQELVRNLEQWRTEQTDLLSQIEDLRRRLAVNQERARQFRRQSAEIEDEIASATSRKAIIKEAIATAEAEIEALAQSEEQESARLQEMQQELALLDSRRKEKQDELTDVQEDSYRLASRIAAARSEMLQIKSRREQIETEIGEHRTHLEEQARQHAQLATQLEQLTEELASLSEEANGIQSQLAAKRKELTQSLATQSELRASLDQAQGETRKLLDRKALLERMRQESAGYGPAARALLTRRSKIPGIVGSVASLMEVPEELEKAIDAALGPLVQAIVVQEWDSIDKAAALLVASDEGQATLISMSDLSHRGEASIPSSSQTIGIASDLVSYPAEYRTLFQHLLGSVIVVRDLKTAREVRRRRETSGARIVTLDGQALGADGTVTVGPRKVEASLLRQEREWRSLPDRINAAREQEKRIESALQKQKDLLTALQDEITELGQRDGAVRSRIRDAEARRTEIEKQHATVSGKLEWHRTATAQLEGELASNLQRQDELQAQIEGDQSKLSALEDRIADLRQQLSLLSDGDFRQRIARLETRLAVAQRARESQVALAQSHRANLSQLEGQVESKREQISHLESECDTLASEAQELTANIEEVEQRLEALRQAAGPAEAEIEDLERARSDGAAEERKAREHLQQLESRGNQLALEKARLQDALTALARQVEEDLGPVRIPSDLSHQLRLELGDGSLSVLQAVPTMPEGLQDEIRDLKAQLRRLSPVNPGAPAEYAETKQRYDFLTGQSEDLENAIASLHEVIDELDQVIETDFRSTFAAVAREFRRYFSLLFEGGSARLILSDPEDMANTGIEILARPPGHRSQSLSLLSGGQRALTATALLFALLKVNPLPFCILDEVDAMLDEANVGRFRELLQQLAQETQFIVITHNRLTIDAAQAIYGVSKGEDGTSQVISLKLPEETRSGEKTRDEGSARTSIPQAQPGPAEQRESG